MTVVNFLGAFGDDLMVVNAARVSYDRWSSDLTDRDVDLICRLARDGHTSPFYHPQAQFRITAPLYVAAQLKRHHVGFAWNEVSRRYTSANIEVELPTLTGEGKTRAAADWEDDFDQATEDLVRVYYAAIADGIPREQARAILPQAMLTTWLWTGSLYAWAMMCRQRLAPEAQAETRGIAEDIAVDLADTFPVSWAALMGGQPPPEQPRRIA